MGLCWYIRLMLESYNLLELGLVNMCSTLSLFPFSSDPDNWTQHQRFNLPELNQPFNYISYLTICAA